MLFSLTLGRYPVPLEDVVRIVFTTFPVNAKGDYTNAPWVVVEIVRMPRILLVTLCGMGLALSGATMQGVFRNPLVGPEVAGVTAGASLGGVAAIMLSWPALGITGLAFAFGVLALAVAFGLAKLAGHASTLALVLSGVIVGGFCSALVGLLQTLADPMMKLPSIVYWLLGSFAGATYEKVAIVAAVTLFAGTLLLALRWRIERPKPQKIEKNKTLADQPSERLKKSNIAEALRRAALRALKRAKAEMHARRLAAQAQMGAPAIRAGVKEGTGEARRMSNAAYAALVSAEINRHSR
jgi:hypothetical protein